MKREIPWDEIVEIIGRFPEGASLEELMLGLSPTIPRRTLQRWLAALIQKGRIIGEGKARSRVYKLSRPHEEKVLFEAAPFPLSKEAQKIQKKISQPIENRKVCHYQRDFLEKYVPNSTFYLSEKIRNQLFQLGRFDDGKYPAGTYARHIFKRLLIDLSWNSSRLEGNTYSLLETEKLLENEKGIEGKDFKETQMILNHKAAIEFLVQHATEIGINRYTIMSLHALLSDNLMSDSASSGRLRFIPVGIAKSTYFPLDVPQLIEECFDLMLSKAKQIEDPFETAFFFMVHLPYLQPFDDVNKRTSRLAANISLIQKNLCPLSFIDVPEHIYIEGLLGVYEMGQPELLRDLFVYAYERSCSIYSQTQKLIGDPDPFRLKYRKEIKEIVHDIVVNRLDKINAIHAIRKVSLKLEKEDQSRFIELVERELQSLHIGNIARFQLRPHDFEKWKEIWSHTETI